MEVENLREVFKVGFVTLMFCLYLCHYPSNVGHEKSSNQSYGGRITRDRLRKALVCFGIVALLAQLNVGAISAESAEIVVSGAVVGKLTVLVHNIIPPTAINPDSGETTGTAWSGDPGYQPGDLQQGGYPNVTGRTVEVRSNVLWSATSSITLPSGSVHVVEGRQPASHAECDGGILVTGQPSNWKRAVMPGIHIYNVYYCVDTEGSQGQGTLAAEVIYRVTQS